MLDTQNQDAGEFKKCGEIMFATKWNKIAMSCNFCHQIFKQLQTFMRHLHIAHSNKVDFVKQLEQVEVYAIEELISQTGNSCPPDVKIEGDETDWLNEADIKWLNEGVEPENKPYNNKSDDLNLSNNEEDDLNLSNISILKALADCEVSIKNNSKCSSKEQSKSNVVQVIQNEWEDSDSSDTTTEKVVENIAKKNLSNSKMLLEVTDELVAMNHLVSTSSTVEDTLKKSLVNSELSPTKCVKRFLLDLQNFEDVDKLLNNLESSAATGADNTIDAKNNTAIEKNNILEENINKIDSNGLKKELEKTLNDDSNIVDNKEINLVQTLHDLENSLAAESIKDKDFYSDLENKPTCSKDNSLNEDLTKTLADALDREDLDLLNLRLEEDSDEPLHKDILDFLEHELLAEEGGKDSQLTNQNQPQIPDTNSCLDNILMEENRMPSLKVECKNTNNPESIKIPKHSATNFITRTTSFEINKSNPTMSTILKESNICHEQIAKHSQKPLEANHGVFLNQQQYAYNTSPVKSPTKSLAHENPNQRMSHQTPQSKTTYKENACLNVEKIKKVKFTPSTSFINTERGNKTPIHRGKMFPPDGALTNIAAKLQKFKQTSKSQEEQNDFNLQQQTTPTEFQIHEDDKPSQKSQSLAGQKVNCNSFVISSHTEKPSTSPTNTMTNKTQLTTLCRKLKTVTVKLQRCTPDKLGNAARTHNIKASKITAKQTDEHFKLPKELTMTTGGGIHNTKAGYNCKQTFSDSHVQNILDLARAKQQSHDRMQADLQRNGRNAAHLHKCNTSNEFVTTKHHKPSNTTHKTPRLGNLDNKSYAVSRSTRKKEVLQRMRNIKNEIFRSIEESELLTKFKSKRSSPKKCSIKQNLIIENVEILPTLTPFTDTFKKPLPYNGGGGFAANKIYPTAKQFEEPQTTNNNAEETTKMSIKRPAECNFTKRCQQIGEKISTELEETQLDLSESCVDFLQRDLKASRLNVESLLYSDGTSNETSTTSIINDLLEQIVNEKHTKDIETHKSTKSNETEDFDEAKDIDLLAKVGLKVIKIPNIEDVILLDERDEMNNKARTFANIYKNWKRIWSRKNSEYLTFKQQLHEHFTGLLAETNAQFNLKLHTIEIKRLVNLISGWYAQNVGNQLIEKRKIDNSTNQYLTYFSYIPKTSKRFYYCEYCEEYFNTEHKYYTHRIIHTGALDPYKCQKCSLGFRRIKQINEHHTSSCSVILPNIIQCLVCKQIFATSELLYEHSMSHLNTIYRCDKCIKVFASEKDVKSHMNICNNLNKRNKISDTPLPKTKQSKKLKQIRSKN